MTDIEDLADRARRTGATIAVAESLTSGNLAAAVGAAEGASDWFAGGVIAYRTATKERVLDLTPGTDPCSSACAEQMAVATRALTGADLAVSTTGVGGPDIQDGHAPGTVYVGWSDASGAGSALLQFDGGPAEIIEKSVAAAVRILLSRLGPAS